MDWVIIKTMTILLNLLVFAFGLIIGSFLNVVLYRLHTGRSLNGRSHCLSCLAVLRWFELLPLVSYLGLRGRCLSCRARIPSRYFLVELLTGGLFVVVWQLAAEPIVTASSFFVVSVLVSVLVYDLRHQIIPDEFTILLTAVATLPIAYNYYLTPTLTHALDSLFSGLLAATFFGLIWFLSGGRWMGFGDVKLAFPLGLLLPLSQVFSMIMLAFYLGAVISLILLGLQFLMRRGQFNLPIFTKTLTIKSAIPFAPFLIAGFLLTYLTDFDLLAFMLYAFS